MNSCRGRCASWDTMEVFTAHMARVDLVSWPSLVGTPSIKRARCGFARPSRSLIQSLLQFAQTSLTVEENGAALCLCSTGWPPSGWPPVRWPLNSTSGQSSRIQAGSTCSLVSSEAPPQKAHRRGTKAILPHRGLCLRGAHPEDVGKCDVLSRRTGCAARRNTLEKWHGVPFRAPCSPLIIER